MVAADLARIAGVGLRHEVSRVTRRHPIPLVGGIAINDRCNLACAHCGVSNRGLPDLTWQEVRTGLATLRGMGIRLLYIEGGEPTLWRDGEYRLPDLVRLARRLGFVFIALYTNGTMGIPPDVDVVFVSLDGPREVNDAIRGRSYDRVVSAIESSAHPRIVLNSTISPRNEAHIERFCEDAAAMPHVTGVFFYFVTPTSAADPLVMPYEARVPVVERLLRLKYAGAPVLNSAAALRRIVRNTWARPARSCYLWANGRLSRCCRSIGDRHACANCGYLGYPELEAISRLDPGALVENLRLVLGDRRRRLRARLWRLRR